jgi:thiol-disulfide isomerase/thioredoxin
MKILLPASIAGLLLLGRVLAQPAETQNTVITPHTKDLLILQGEKLVPFQSAEFLKAPYTILYFGAGWCPDCRRFSPALVDAYNQQPKGGHRFQVVLFSMDKTADGMLRFMKTEKMIWPAIAFDKIGTADDLKKYYSGHGIPCLSVIDLHGKLILQSKSDQDAQEILKGLQDLINDPKSKEH